MKRHEKASPQKGNRFRPCLVGGWSNPFEQYAQVKLDHETPGIGVKIPKIFELPPPSNKQTTFANKQPLLIASRMFQSICNIHLCCSIISEFQPLGHDKCTVLPSGLQTKEYQMYRHGSYAPWQRSKGWLGSRIRGTKHSSFKPIPTEIVFGVHIAVHQVGRENWCWLGSSSSHVGGGQ